MDMTVLYFYKRMRGHVLDQVFLLCVFLASKILTVDEMLEDFFLYFSDFIKPFLLSAMHRDVSMSFDLSSEIFLFSNFALFILRQ